MTETLDPIPLVKPILGEAEKRAVLSVLESANLVQGDVVEELERGFAQLCGAKHAVATSSGTTALHLALLAHGVGPGDEVITTAFTFVASANSVLHCGARPVFVDIEPDTYNIDPHLLEAAITPRSKAILPVHLYGNPADMVAIREIARRYGLAVVEDAAQAHCATIGGRPVGSEGTACFSLYATKNMTAGEGGIVTTDDAEVADRVRRLRSHGARERYHHEILGFNARLSDLHAAIGVAQLRQVRGWTEIRRANAARLTERLADTLTTPAHRPWANPVFHQYTIRVPGGRGDIAATLAGLGVGSDVHYPTPVHRQPLYVGLGYGDTLPHAELACEEVLSIPVHPSLNPGEVDRVADAVIEALRRRGQPRGD